MYFLVETKAVYAETLAADMEVVHFDARGTLWRFSTLHDFYMPIINLLISQDQ